MVRRTAERQFNMRLNPDDSRRFQKVADKYALSITGAIRMLVKREFDAIVADEKAARR
jgi:antitoxin component of RelBE/YafQ-DinJ toxin-antitoxin module